MDTDFFIGPMEGNTVASGSMENNMEREFTLILTELKRKANGLREREPNGWILVMIARIDNLKERETFILFHLLMFSFF